MLGAGALQPLEGMVQICAPGEHLGDLVRQVLSICRDELVESLLRLFCSAERVQRHRFPILTNRRLWMLLKPLQRRRWFAFVQLGKRHFAGHEASSRRGSQAFLKHGSSERLLARGVVKAPEEEGSQD